ncbi:MAG: hypothetical protein MZV70_44560 [Desulfobacterales bacterium]|nr:hypothetical protein [Desulfobacterales bacterium]
MLTNEGYAREKKVCAGTLFAIPFISEMGTEYFEKELDSKMPNHEELGVDVAVVPGQCCSTDIPGSSMLTPGWATRRHCRARSRDMAERLELRYEERHGNLAGPEGPPPGHQGPGLLPRAFRLAFR